MREFNEVDKQNYIRKHKSQKWNEKEGKGK